MISPRPLLPALLVAALIATSTPAEAEEPLFPFELEIPVGFGFGAIMGVPTGLSFAYRPESGPYYDAAIAWSATEERLLFHADAVKEITQVVDPHAPNAKFPLYAGFGARFGYNTDQNGVRSSHLGIRAPMGINILPQGTDLDIFAEIVPVIALFPDTRLTFDGAVGARYYFY